ncbi:MAG: aspartate/glutamate racemase family protein [Rhodobacter sp.]|nr:aspartate/glutamate racemase family protein [Rhodobacter sp.]
MHIALLHTAEIHVATFQAIFAGLGRPVRLTQRVEADLLEQARTQGTEAVRGATIAALADLAGADAVICTCSTLGPLADDFARSNPQVFRIDQPLMRAACAHGPRILVAICLESTRAPTLDLLRDTARELGRGIRPEVILCDAAWPLFEAGDSDGFARNIASRIDERARRGDIDCIVLAQASMRVAAPLLAHPGVPVLTSPDIAAAHAISLARTGGS